MSADENGVRPTLVGKLAFFKFVVTEGYLVPGTDPSVSKATFKPLINRIGAFLQSASCVRIRLQEIARFTQLITKSVIRGATRQGHNAQAAFSKFRAKKSL